jgi:hypothetical protein
MKNSFAIFVLGLFVLCGAVLGTLAYAAAPARTAALSWTATTQDTDGNTITGVTYNVYQGAKGSSSKTKVAQGLTVLSYTATNLPYGETCFNVSAQTVALGESALSAEGCKSFPLPKPAAPSLTVE